MTIAMGPKGSGSGHIHTWLRWIETLSPLAHEQSIAGARQRLAMAEALSYAAPGGPLGFVHLGDCNCERQSAPESEQLFTPGELKP